MIGHPDAGPCVVCGTGQPVAAYEGPVRRGVFGDFLDGRILRCQACALEWLVADETLALRHYQTGEYRERVAEEATVQHFFAAHDKEQFEKVFRVRGVLTRGSAVADVGCAAGAFLDFTGGVASRTHCGGARSDVSCVAARARPRSLVVRKRSRRCEPRSGDVVQRD